MSLPWYYLERPARIVLLRCYYTTCALVYPAFAAYNWKSFIPDRAQVLGVHSLQEEIVNPLHIKK